MQILTTGEEQSASNDENEAGALQDLEILSYLAMGREGGQILKTKTSLAFLIKLFRKLKHQAKWESCFRRLVGLFQNRKGEETNPHGGI